MSSKKSSSDIDEEYSEFQDDDIEDEQQNKQNSQEKDALKIEVHEHFQKGTNTHYQRENLINISSKSIKQQQQVVKDEVNTVSMQQQQQICSTSPLSLSSKQKSIKIQKSSGNPQGIIDNTSYTDKSELQPQAVVQVLHQSHDQTATLNTNKTKNNLLMIQSNDVVKSTQRSVSISKFKDQDTKIQNEQSIVHTLQLQSNKQNNLTVQMLNSSTSHNLNQNQITSGTSNVVNSSTQSLIRNKKQQQQQTYIQNHQQFSLLHPPTNQNLALSHQSHSFTKQPSLTSIKQEPFQNYNQTQPTQQHPQRHQSAKLVSQSHNINNQGQTQTQISRKRPPSVSSQKLTKTRSKQNQSKVYQSQQVQSNKHSKVTAQQQPQIIQQQMGGKSQQPQQYSRIVQSQQQTQHFLETQELPRLMFDYLSNPVGNQHDNYQQQDCSTKSFEDLFDQMKSDVQIQQRPNSDELQAQQSRMSVQKQDDLKVMQKEQIIKQYELERRQLEQRYNQLKEQHQLRFKTVKERSEQLKKLSADYIHRAQLEVAQINALETKKFVEEPDQIVQRWISSLVVDSEKCVRYALLKNIRNMQKIDEFNKEFQQQRNSSVMDYLANKRNNLFEMSYSGRKGTISTAQNTSRNNNENQKRSYKIQNAIQSFFNEKQTSCQLISDIQFVCKVNSETEIPQKIDKTKNSYKVHQIISKLPSFSGIFSQYSDLMHQNQKLFLDTPPSPQFLPNQDLKQLKQEVGLLSSPKSSLNQNKSHQSFQQDIGSRNRQKLLSSKLVQLLSEQNFVMRDCRIFICHKQDLLQKSDSTLNMNQSGTTSPVNRQSQNPQQNLKNLYDKAQSIKSLIKGNLIQEIESQKAKLKGSQSIIKQIKGQNQIKLSFNYAQQASDQYCILSEAKVGHLERSKVYERYCQRNEDSQNQEDSDERYSSDEDQEVQVQSVVSEFYVIEEESMFRVSECSIEDKLSQGSFNDQTQSKIQDQLKIVKPLQDKVKRLRKLNDFEVLLLIQENLNITKLKDTHTNLKLNLDTQFLNNFPSFFSHQSTNHPQSPSLNSSLVKSNLLTIQKSTTISANMPSYNNQTISQANQPTFPHNFQPVQRQSSFQKLPYQNNGNSNPSHSRNANTPQTAVNCTNQSNFNGLQNNQSVSNVNNTFSGAGSGQVNSEVIQQFGVQKEQKVFFVLNKLNQNKVRKVYVYQGVVQIETDGPQSDGNGVTMCMWPGCLKMADQSLLRQIQAQSVVQDCETVTSLGGTGSNKNSMTNISFQQNLVKSQHQNQTSSTATGGTSMTLNTSQTPSNIAIPCSGNSSSNNMPKRRPESSHGRNKHNNPQSTHQANPSQSQSMTLVNPHSNQNTSQSNTQTKRIGRLGVLAFELEVIQNAQQMFQSINNVANSKSNSSQSTQLYCTNLQLQLGSVNYFKLIKNKQLVSGTLTAKSKKQQIQFQDDQDVNQPASHQDKSTPSGIQSCEYHKKLELYLNQKYSVQLIPGGLMCNNFLKAIKYRSNVIKEWKEDLKNSLMQDLMAPIELGKKNQSQHQVTHNLVSNNKLGQTYNKIYSQIYAILSQNSQGQPNILNLVNVLQSQPQKINILESFQDWIKQFQSHLLLIYVKNNQFFNVTNHFLTQVNCFLSNINQAQINEHYINTEIQKWIQQCAQQKNKMILQQKSTANGPGGSNIKQQNNKGPQTANLMLLKENLVAMHDIINTKDVLHKFSQFQLLMDKINLANQQQLFLLNSSNQSLVLPTSSSTSQNQTNPQMKSLQTSIQFNGSNDNGFSSSSKQPTYTINAIQNQGLSQATSINSTTNIGIPQQPQIIHHKPQSAQLRSDLTVSQQNALKIYASTESQQHGHQVMSQTASNFNSRVLPKINSFQEQQHQFSGNLLGQQVQQQKGAKGGVTSGQAMITAQKQSQQVLISSKKSLNSQNQNQNHMQQVGHHSSLIPYATGIKQSGSTTHSTNPQGVMMSLNNQLSAQGNNRFNQQLNTVDKLNSIYGSNQGQVAIQNVTSQQFNNLPHNQVVTAVNQRPSTASVVTASAQKQNATQMLYNTQASQNPKTTSIVPQSNTNAIKQKLLSQTNPPIHQQQQQYNIQPTKKQMQQQIITSVYSQSFGLGQQNPHSQNLVGNNPNLTPNLFSIQQQSNALKNSKNLVMHHQTQQQGHHPGGPVRANSLVVAHHQQQTHAVYSQGQKSGTGGKPQFKKRKVSSSQHNHHL